MRHFPQAIHILAWDQFISGCRRLVQNRVSETQDARSNLCPSQKNNSRTDPKKQPCASAPHNAQINAKTLIAILNYFKWNELNFNVLNP
jgi:hypothetical protein